MIYPVHRPTLQYMPIYKCHYSVLFIFINFNEGHIEGLLQYLFYINFHIKLDIFCTDIKLLAFKSPFTKIKPVGINNNEPTLLYDFIASLENHFSHSTIQSDYSTYTV